MARRSLNGLLGVLVGLSLLGAPLLVAHAQDWKAMRAAGQIGERYDGFLVPRDAAAAPVAAPINDARRELYQKRAAETGATIGQVGRIYFKENLANLPAGTWILQENGSWTQK